MSGALPERLRVAVVAAWRSACEDGALAPSMSDVLRHLDAVCPGVDQAARPQKCRSTSSEEVSLAAKRRAEATTELAAQQPEPSALVEAVLSGRKELRERIVQEWGECCQGGDPACHGPGGCLLIQAMNRPEAQAAAAQQPEPPAAGEPSEVARLRAAIEWAMGGPGSDFRERREGEGAYYWRKELAERAGCRWEDGAYQWSSASAPAEVAMRERAALAEVVRKNLPCRPCGVHCVPPRHTDGCPAGCREDLLADLMSLWPPARLEAVREVMTAMAERSEEPTAEGTEAERWLFRLRKALDPPKEDKHG